LTIRQSHTEKKLHNRKIELLRETWREGFGNLAAVGLRLMNFEKMLNAEGKQFDRVEIPFYSGHVTS
jgi:hypothetical protein